LPENFIDQNDDQSQVEEESESKNSKTTAS